MYISMFLHCILQSMICEGYRGRLYQLRRKELSRMWLAVFTFFILTDSMVNSELASDMENYQFVNDGRLDYMMHYMVPRDYNDKMNSKSLTNFKWQHFSKNNFLYSNEDEILSKTIIQTLALILKEPVILLSPKNATFHDETKPVIQAICLMANVISSSAIQRHKLSLYANHILQEEGVKLLNRESLFEHHSHTLHDSDVKSTQAVPPTSTQAIVNVCASCQMREKVKLKSLESIKKLILIRLQLQRLPNITKPIAVPNNIIDKFYKNFHGAVTDNFVGYSMNSEARNAEGQQKNINPILPQYTKRMHRTHDLYRQRRLFDNQNTQRKYQTIHRSRSKPSLHPSIIHSHENYEKLFESTENMQNDEYVQNDDFQPQYDDQQMLSKNNRRERMNYQQEQLFPPIEGDIYDGLPHENYGTYDPIRDVDDESFSHVNSIYVFPSVSRMRHNRRWDVINFKFDHSHLTIIRTIIHLYIRGRDWMRKHYPDILKQTVVNGSTMRSRDLIIMIHHVVRGSHYQNRTHTLKLVESRHHIPAGLGQWVQFEVKHKLPFWPQQNYITMTLAIKTREAWMRPFLVIHSEDAQNNQFPLHIEAFIRQPRRRKRSTSLDCKESDHEVRCCRYPLKVNFTNFGWNFVVAPTSFDAYFCNGECKVGYLEQYTHTHIASLTTSATPCCSPTKMNSLSLLYFDQDHNLVLSTIPNMSVEKCSCS
ncbi:uncharacterized protein LOC120780086 isoform X1 [Bactrocera tryoni]|uniref:uncharacterized protein LOC120780086 isoform X1 n=2 Tax=Bactrocera tryoni TaxID=59916 RepID=UPI001A96E28F|nr:uncharacterized protein LOC120780086 isoform X1 [Bactrocera tryoni]XP_039968290.1 uncharacterized protein LOC120780086 isoform X1 [Bactrocera tryoni]XP_039968291.1 uncharacterized protein LOC120780086 isoform X1 [Bactrocera tryoni]XP_039968292.1 uncharacterized protein LOC120780086 isoform X1 [Bactrocera tryoni]XP_039968293.1 uncharacterized protein LOC120780086 isoform X1 [Bactrocera tryoni]XP_039968294.1 uncharacterized protein LOC120780086 isoform X1 [Bactrocera tryoni]XP_039968295.1 un